MKKIIEVYTDGATIGHNGKLGTVKEVGLGLYIPSINFGDGKRVKGISNNEAEFKALIWGMEVAAEKGLKDVRFNMDSKIVVNRANGARAKGKYWNERMNTFQDVVFEFRKKFDYILFRWIPREENSTADYYSNLAKSLKIKT
jgi:ribonuclease HI